MKNKNVFTVLISLMVVLFLISSCEDIIEPDLKECPDSRFIGNWERYNKSSVDYYQMYSLWGSQNYLLDEWGFQPKKPLEWKKEDNQYFRRHWNENDSWKSFDLQYIDENFIIIDGDIYAKTTKNLLRSIYQSTYVWFYKELGVFKVPMQPKTLVFTVYFH